MNSSRHHLETFIQAMADELPPHSLLLDAGAGDCRYARRFGMHRYESADFAKVKKPYGELTYVCDLTAIPVEDGRFDAILCSQVIAHLPEPRSVLREFHRVLKPGGRLYVTGPLYFQENEPPYDFFRYTQYGLRRILDDAGLEVERLDWLEGYGGTVAYQLGMAAQTLRARPADFGGGPTGWTAATATVFVRPLFAALSLLYARCDIAYRNTAIGHCKNYAAVARRPPKAPDSDA